MRATPHHTVTPGRNPGVHIFKGRRMAGFRPAMTTFGM